MRLVLTRSIIIYTLRWEVAKSIIIYTLRLELARSIIIYTLRWELDRSIIIYTLRLELARSIIIYTLRWELAKSIIIYTLRWELAKSIINPCLLLSSNWSLVHRQNRSFLFGGSLNYTSLRYFFSIFEIVFPCFPWIPEMLNGLTIYNV